MFCFAVFLTIKGSNFGGNSKRVPALADIFLVQSRFVLCFPTVLLLDDHIPLLTGILRERVYAVFFILFTHFIKRELF